ncbi:class I SAM-dependent methyltransferase [Ferrimonas lipolytica]|uniref:Class I SAM-dependent methyltransferase n=2 Tax=Ferrimonas lipolytica TaxID=2724191 RepID=A0A6H1UIK7_9GAMM|nr:class I SAM-dependent methyltransferase [Ferrimonas lipolytica]
MSMLCPLCQHIDPQHYHQDKRRHYFQCPQCKLVFADPAALLPASAEKQIYDQHQNNPDDLGYRKFLNRLAAPLLLRLPLQQQGLDFGCGPGPTLSLMLADAGHEMALYDPYFVPDRSPLKQQYDFVTCTEAIEHFYQPRREWHLLLNLIRPGGYLGIMTKLVRNKDAFAQWHYKNDPTHVSFFSEATFRYLAKQHNLRLEILGNDIILLQKSA